VHDFLFKEMLEDMLNICHIKQSLTKNPLK